MSGPALPRGLYAITDSERIPRGNTTARVAQAIDGGAVLIQYREKFHSREERGREAQALVMLCRERGIPLIIN
jgi:thiamine-phosphate pyrophosphorylase